MNQSEPEQTSMSVRLLAVELGVAPETLRQWLQRKHPSTLSVKLRREGGRLAMVAPEGAAAARAHYGEPKRALASLSESEHAVSVEPEQALALAREPESALSPPHGSPVEPTHERTGAHLSEPVRTDAQAHDAGWLAALAEVRRELDRALAERDTARVEIETLRRQLEQAERGQAAALNRVADLRSAWWRWRLQLSTLGPVARLRRRWPADPPEVESLPRLSPPSG